MISQERQAGDYRLMTSPPLCYAGVQAGIWAGIRMET